MADNFIHDFWQKRAVEFGEKADASWGDQYTIDLEVQTIGGYIPQGAVVLDVGCANGHATFRHLSSGIVSRIVGVDFSEEMVKQAEAKRERLAADLQQKCAFQQGNILKLDFPDNSYDVVYTTRVLINLPTWELQIQGIEECLRVCRAGGKVILSEGFWEPFVTLNGMRCLAGLPPLAEPDFNRYLKKAKLEDFLAQSGRKFEVNNFSAIYYLGSRFLREIIDDKEATAGYTNPINKTFFEMEKNFTGGNFGVNQAYIISKS